MAFTACAIALLINQYQKDKAAEPPEIPLDRQQIAPTEPKIDKSPTAQARREKLIKNLIKNGVLYKVDQPGSFPRMWVTPDFYRLNFDDKTTTAALVYMLYFSDEDNYVSVRIMDSRSGKQVGEYSRESRLQMY